MVLPASAHGATIDVRETFGQEAVTYIADDGEENTVTMTLSRDDSNWRVRVVDFGPQTLGAGCEATADRCDLHHECSRLESTLI